MYYIYQTKNLIDEKIYVGVHLSNDINNDNYLGSGIHLKRAIKKHGI
jgi:group I intron endonuclease